MPRFEIIAGLDVGTTKVCLALARKQFGSQDAQILGCWAAACNGLFSSGTITDLTKIADTIGVLLEKCQDDAKQKISTAFVNITGTHIVSENIRGKVNILDKENEISRKDLQVLYNNAKLSAVTYDREPLLVVPQDYLVDGQAAIKNPVGLFGTKLEADYLFVTGSTPAIENLCKAVSMGGLEVEELVLSNSASSLSVLGLSEKDVGVILVDIGGSITEITIFSEGLLRYDRMLAIGSENLVKSIAGDLKVQHNVADEIVKNYCKLYLPSPQNPQEKILLKEIPPPKTITQGELQKITELRIREMLNTIKESIQSSNYASFASAGVVLIGGISTMDGLAELAETVFNMPVRVGSIRGAWANNMQNSSYITAVGLVKYGSQTRSEGILGRQLSKNIFKRTFQAARDFIYDYF